MQDMDALRRRVSQQEEELTRLRSLIHQPLASATAVAPPSNPHTSPRVSRASSGHKAPYASSSLPTVARVADLQKERYGSGGLDFPMVFGGLQRKGGPRIVDITEEEEHDMRSISRTRSVENSEPVKRRESARKRPLEAELRRRSSQFDRQHSDPTFVSDASEGRYGEFVRRIGSQSPGTHRRNVTAPLSMAEAPATSKPRTSPRGAQATTTTTTSKRRLAHQSSKAVDDKHDTAQLRAQRSLTETGSSAKQHMRSAVLNGSLKRIDTCPGSVERLGSNSSDSMANGRNSTVPITPESVSESPSMDDFGGLKVKVPNPRKTWHAVSPIAPHPPTPSLDDFKNFQLPNVCGCQI